MGSANGNGWRSRKMLRTQAAAVWLCDRGLDGAQSQSTNSRPVISEQLRQHFAHSWSHQLQEKKTKNKINKTRFGGKRFFFLWRPRRKTLPSKIPLKTEHSERAAATAVFITASRSGAARRLCQPGTAWKKKREKKKSNHLQKVPVQRCDAAAEALEPLSP